MTAAGRGYPDSTQDWREVAADVLDLVRRELGPHLRARLESHDVVQDVMLQVLSSRDSYDETRCRGFRDWVTGVVRHRICNLVEYHAAQRRAASREATLCPERLATETLDDDLVRGECAHLMACLERLPDEQRSLILLRDFERLPWAEVARRLDRPSEDAARVAYARAVVQLTRQFEASSTSDGRES